jgi:hypothetical protein
VALICSLLFVAACHHAKPIENFSDQPVASGTTKLPLDEIVRRIKVAGTSVKWTVTDSGPGKLIANYDSKGHDAIVAITFDEEKYSIALVSSQNLHQQGDLINRRYNSWVERLKGAIDRELLAATSTS